MSAPVVEARGLGKVFGTGDAETEALRGIDLEIAGGDFVSLIGPSGCGKSTLLRLIGDLVSPTTGTLVVNGKDPGQARLDRDYGIVFQSATLLDWRNVQKNVELPLEIMDFPDAERPTRAKEMLDLVQLGGFADHYPWQLSGGMQQRVAIARALAFRPALLLMDEPFGALDEMTREAMQQEVLRVWGETGTSVVFVTHSIPEAVFLSTRVVVMSPRPGRISDEIVVDLPPKRDLDTREDPRYFELVIEVREALRRGESGEQRVMTERDDQIQETSITDVFASFEGDVPASGRRSSPARLVRRYLPAVFAFLAVLLVWEGLTRLFGVESFVLSKPSEILTSFSETFGVIWGAGMRTLFEAAGGFVIGTSLAVATSLAAAHWVGFRQGVLPLAIVLNATPIAALAPIFNNWFGLTNPFSKMAVVAVVVYFPVMINTTRGLLEVDPAELELMRSLAASPSEVTRRIRIPRALPYFFSSLKVASVLSLIAAIIAEYFGGPQDVLGQYIVNRAQLFQFPDAWAAILVASILGVVFYLLILAAERWLMPWHVSFRTSE